MKLLITYLQQYGEINRMMTTKNGLFSKFREENYLRIFKIYILTIYLKEYLKSM